MSNVEVIPPKDPLAHPISMLWGLLGWFSNLYLGQKVGKIGAHYVLYTL